MSKAPPVEPLLISHSEAARLSGFSLATWHRKIAAGAIGPRPLSIGIKTKRWRRAELLAWIDTGCPGRQEWQARVDAEKPLRRIG